MTSAREVWREDDATAKNFELEILNFELLPLSRARSNQSPSQNTMVLRLLLAPITGPFTGVTWIAEKILEQAETETDDLETLQKQLLTLQLAFDMGDIPEAEFEAQEEDLLLAIQTIQDERQAESGL
jgi:hypothetical protein